jgi:RNA polymerase sigma-70 factor (ECF subfamily)
MHLTAVEVEMQGVATAAEQRPTECSPPATKQGYDSDFSAIFGKYYTRVFAFIYSRVRDADVSKDLASEVFERAYLKGNSVRDPAAYSAWLFMIAKNVIAGHYRQRKRELVYQSKVEDGLRVAGTPPQPEDFALRDERIGHLMKLVRTLPVRDQELISLKFDAELSHEEIGRIMGITPLNVRVSIFRAVKRLRARMERDGLA